jgi:multisubunit Na+/H+ antiporter MnhF subunit
MPVPVQLFLLCFTVVTIALPLVALRAFRGGTLNDTVLSLSWVPLVTWVVTPIIVLMSGQTPPSRTTSAVVAVILLGGLGAAVVVALAKGAPRVVRNVAWACALGLLLRPAFAAVAAIHLLQT